MGEHGHEHVRELHGVPPPQACVHACSDPRPHVSPFSGCLSAVLVRQVILAYMLVESPLIHKHLTHLLGQCFATSPR